MKKILAISCAALCVATFPGCGNDSTQTSQPHQKQAATQTKTTRYVAAKYEPYFVPEFLDSNGLCGIASNDNGDKVAVASIDGVCPTEEAVEARGFKYIETTMDYRPKPVDGFCGYAHLEHGINMISEKEFNKLQDTVGDVTQIAVNSKDETCPLISELSDVFQNSVSVPLRFNYNEININPEGYDVMEFGELKQEVGMLDPKDRNLMEIFDEKDKFYSANGIEIPKVFVNNDSRGICGDDMSGCDFDDKKLTLTNTKTGDEYAFITANGYYLPKYMLTRGAFDICYGDFKQCNFEPNEANTQGTVTNIVTSESYTSPEANDVTQGV